MKKTRAIEDSTDTADTEGLDQIFDSTVTPVSADRSDRRLIEVSVTEAAKRLGTSERTIWRRITRGELKSRSKGSKRFVKIPVYIPDAQVDNDRQVTVTDTPSEVNAVVDLQALLRELQSATYRVGYLEAQLENSTEQVKLLPDLQAQAAKAEALATRTAELENELTELKRSWWYRFNAWLNGRP